MSGPVELNSAGKLLDALAAYEISTYSVFESKPIFVRRDSGFRLGAGGLIYLVPHGRHPFHWKEQGSQRKIFVHTSSG
ncbi:hypothetical protein AG1IA_01839 [Rhizoctonia solani AG-1 IA]|uniref:Uncharacterized protein n=1 Tax=Thanatephorus cucumeris (strain AG1-IA) TaxID=983506 RepID=L8X1C4_THACA|nr:hypothetical protein AG1IA_01839 [Rhizoctonia solani AG-1 IA]